MGVKGNAIFAQSGGPVSVINSSICGAIQEARKHDEITAMCGSINGILGVLSENMVDLNRESRRKMTLPISSLLPEIPFNKGKKIPLQFINEEGNGVSRKFLEYVTPLIGGPLPEYTRLERHFVGKRLA